MLLSETPLTDRGLTRGQRVFQSILITASVALVVWTAVGRLREPPAPLATAPDLDRQAQDYLRSHKPTPLTGPLRELLTDPEKWLVKTQPHPLLDRSAPDFDLTDQEGKHWRLNELRERGPVVIVFYFGYHCNHCVSQLFDIHEDMARFRELGTEVVAISADPPETTAKRFRQYGRFAFPVLSDPGNHVAAAYGVFRPGGEGREAQLEHGTFLIGSDGQVVWVHTGEEPFSGNRSLLFEVARLQGRLATAAREEPQRGR